MNEPSVINNPHILKKLCRRIDYLNDFPASIEGEDLEDARLLGTLETDDFLGFVLGYSPEEGEVSPDHFKMLSKEENRQLNHYRLIKPVLPWPQPILGISVPGGEPGKVTGIHRVPVVLKPCGVAQVWWGGDVAVLWEALLDGDVKERQDYEALMNQLWGCCEVFLKGQGVRQVYTYNRDDEYPLKWYQGFLERRGYVPVKDRKITVRKILGYVRAG